jgi:hypothetical protein
MTGDIVTGSNTLIILAATVVFDCLEGRFDSVNRSSKEFPSLYGQLSRRQFSAESDVQQGAPLVKLAWHLPPFADVHNRESKASWECVGVQATLMMMMMIISCRQAISYA